MESCGNSSDGPQAHRVYGVMRNLGIAFWVTVVAMMLLGGCMANSAYYLEEAGAYRSYNTLRAEALRICPEHDEMAGLEITARDLQWVKAKDSEVGFDLQGFLVPMTLGIVPQRSDGIRTWKVWSGDWKREIRIREISHESIWPTGAIPAALGADKRSIHCPDNNEAFKTEKAFAEEIARMLYVVERNSL